MRRGLQLALVFLLAVATRASAQTPPVANIGDNANIIPIYKSSDPPTGDDYLRGNLLGQRCNEPSIAVFENNPQTRMVFCNDYRATFNWDDAIVPSGKTSLLAAAWGSVKTFMARLTGRPAPQKTGPKIIASAEAGIGGGLTYGDIWHGFMVPGGPNDNSPASLAHPGKAMGLQGYSDPWAINVDKDTIGAFYIGFTRDKISGQTNRSAIFFTRYRNLNNSDVEHNVHLVEPTSVVVDSNNLSQGQFWDKVSGARGADGILYAAFTRFTGAAGSSAIHLARSSDGGVSWSSESIDTNSKYGQGTVLLANPTLAKASTVGVLWRTFGTASLVYRRYGKGTKNVDLFAKDPDGPYVAFDQYAQPIQNDPSRVAFRSLAFPAATYTSDGSRLLVFFTEWINLTTGKPGTSGPILPMIVMKVSTDDGATWSNRYVLASLSGERRIVNSNVVAEVPASPERLGFFSPARPLGAQFFPAVACNTGGQCLVIWKQAYTPELTSGGLENAGSAVLSGFSRRFDVRGALVSFGNSGPVVTPSFQASRYGYKELEGTEKPSDVADTDDWVAKMELPNGTTYPLFSYDNINHTGGGALAFAGDYLSAVAIPGNPSAFMVGFSDNRYNIWPWQTETGGLVPSGQEWRYYPVFMAPDDPENKIPGVSCVNYGSRVQSVMVADVTPRPLVFTAQANHKDFTTSTAPKACGWGLDAATNTYGPTEQCIEFPVTIRNMTGAPQTVGLELLGTTGAPASNASFAKRPHRVELGEEFYPYKLRTGSVTIYPYSSYSTNVYAFDANPITVKATGAGSTADLTLNDPGVAGASGTAAYTYSPSKVSLESGASRSGASRSGASRSGASRSGASRSYPVPEDPVPGQTVYDVIDYTYVVSPTTSDDAGTYLSLLNIDPAYEGNYVFQAVVTNSLTSFMIDKYSPCEAFNWIEGGLVGHISDPTNPLVSGASRSGASRSGASRSGASRSAVPSDGDPLVQNTSFTLASSTNLSTSGSGAMSTMSIVSGSTATSTGSGCRIDECSKAAPRLPNEVTILVRAYQIQPTAAIPPDRRYDPDGSRFGGDPTPPGVAVAEYSCDTPECTSALGPDLVVSASSAPVAPNTVVAAGGQLAFADTISIRNEGENGECGTADAPKPCGDAAPHQWALYASTVSDFSLLPRTDCSPAKQGTYECPTGAVSGTILENSDPSKEFVTIRLSGDSHPKLVCDPTSSTDPTCDGATESAGVAAQVTIPLSIPRTNANGTGTYYLHYYDDTRRIVNELDETNNNWSGGPIIVEPPLYQFIGLFSPCGPGPFCTQKSGTNAIPLAWQYSYDGVTAVDTANLVTVARVYRGSATCGISTPRDQCTRLAQADPTNISSGSSGWQYFPTATASRPAFTWQVNLKQVDDTGQAYGPGTYYIDMEVPATAQCNSTPAMTGTVTCADGKGPVTTLTLTLR